MTGAAVRILLAGLLWLAAALPSAAVLPDEVLDDPQLEARARSLSAELRCLVCQNQSIDDSDAELARDLRILVRERLEAGDSDEQVMAYIVARYGEFVLLRPQFNLRNAVLWGAPILLLAFGASAMLIASRKRRVTAPAPLSEAEQQRLRRILDGSE